MKNRETKLVYKALLGQIGQLVARSRCDWTTPSSVLGQNWLQEVAPRLATYLRESEPLIDDLVAQAYELLAISDSPLGGTDHSSAYQADIFRYFGQEMSKGYYSPVSLLSLTEPHTAQKESQGPLQDEKVLLEELAKDLSNIEPEEMSLGTLLISLENYLSYVPASITVETDLSLYEQSKLVAAVALCWYRYCIENQLQGSSLDQLKTKETFLLASFDLSGIQDFIYNIVSKGALKQLKARSLYLDMMSEYLSDSLLRHLKLNRVNLLYSGGGHAYLLLPNTPQTLLILEQLEKDFNAFLLEQFASRLYVAFGWASFTADLFIENTDTIVAYKTVHRQISQQLSQKKLSRYTAEVLLELNRGGQSSERECLICHSTINLQPTTLCSVCQGLADFSKKITWPYYAVTTNCQGLPIGPGRYLQAFQQLPSAVSIEVVYVKNNLTSQKMTTPIFVGDYAYTTIDRYAMESVVDNPETGVKEGFKRMAVVRLDVDDLGAAFMAGFSKQADGRYHTMLRSAAFSKQMSRFYKYHINQLADRLKLSIVYAGGDDVFAIGSWQDIIAFTVKLRQTFINWTSGKLTLSAGIGLFTEKTPVNIMARETGDLEESAKGNGKDSICLFDERYTFTFDQFINRVQSEKYECIKTFFEKQSQRGKVFAYKLLELLQTKNRMNVARLAYYLACLEKTTVADKRSLFDNFKKDFYRWYTADDETVKEAELALMLYIYETRKEQ